MGALRSLLKIYTPCDARPTSVSSSQNVIVYVPTPAPRLHEAGSA